MIRAGTAIWDLGGQLERDGVLSGSLKMRQMGT